MGTKKKASSDFYVEPLNKYTYSCIYKAIEETGDFVWEEHRIFLKIIIQSQYSKLQRIIHAIMFLIYCYRYHFPGSNQHTC